jgi:hypothetical protein
MENDELRQRSQHEPSQCQRQAAGPAHTSCRRVARKYVGNSRTHGLASLATGLMAWVESSDEVPTSQPTDHGPPPARKRLLASLASGSPGLSPTPSSDIYHHSLISHSPGRPRTHSPPIFFHEES